MSDITFLLTAIFVSYFIFTLVAQFLVGQLAIAAGSLMLGVLAYQIAVEAKDKIYRGLIISFGLMLLLLVSYYFAFTSKTACDGYYIGKVFEKSGELIQSGAEISASNYSDVCYSPGFRHACNQYNECNQKFAALRALPLFLSGLLCILVGAITGLLRASWKQLPVSVQSLDSKLTTTETTPKVATDFNLSTFANNYPLEFEKSTLAQLASLSGKSERSIKSFITKNNLRCVDYQSRKDT